jgi:hypothetical protein
LVYQSHDYRKREDIRANGGKYSVVYNHFFPRYLLEQTWFLRKALEANDEKHYPEKEGNIHLKLANTNFLW